MPTFEVSVFIHNLLICIFMIWKSDKILSIVKEIFMDRILIMCNIKFRNNVFFGYGCIDLYAKANKFTHIKCLKSSKKGLIFFYYLKRKNTS